MRRFIWGARASRFLLLSAIVASAVLIERVETGGSAAAHPFYRNDDLPLGVFVSRVYYKDISDLDELAAYDVWEYNNLKSRYVLVSMDAAVYYELQAQGWRLAIDRSSTQNLREAQAQNLFANGYRTVAELTGDLAAIAASHPTLTEVVDYGDSYCKGIGGCQTPGGDVLAGHDLLAIRVTNEYVRGSSTVSGNSVISGTKPVFFLVANIHAREITTPELTMRFLESLLTGFGIDADLTWLVDWHEIWIVPTANPDGHWLVELGEQQPYNGSPFYQRKNANQGDGCNTWQPTTFDQYGVDLNRNHSFAWGGLGSNTSPCSQTFRGSSAASEPEVTHLQALIRSLISDQRGPMDRDAAPQDASGLFITLHSFGELILWPWGFTDAPAPNRAGLQAIGDKLATYNGYLSCQPGSCLYHASGTSDDWAYGELGIPAFTFEVGPSEFMPAYGAIDSNQWPKNGPALLYAARIARRPYSLALGPDAVNVSFTTTPTDMALNAVIDDSDNGAQSISEAAYTIDTPYWVSGAVTHTLSAVDGVFDSAIEAVETSLDPSTVSLGQHTFFVRGRDSSGHWGPVSATYGQIQQQYTTYFAIVVND